MAVDVPNFGRYISTSTTALAVVIANRRVFMLDQKNKLVYTWAAAYEGFLGGSRPHCHQELLDPKLQNEPLNFWPVIAIQHDLLWHPLHPAPWWEGRGGHFLLINAKQWFVKYKCVFLLQFCDICLLPHGSIKKIFWRYMAVFFLNWRVSGSQFQFFFLSFKDNGNRPSVNS